METNNIVSIIIPCYNQAQYLEESVQSALDQTYEHIEIIIVNDGSTDHTEMVARQFTEQFPDKVKLISKTNAGLAEARNSGIEASSGEYILPLDSDDMIHEDLLSECLETVNRYAVDIVTVDGQTFGEKNYRINTKEFPECMLLYNNCLIVTSFFSRKVWEKNGGYKKNMDSGYEDWEFWINAYRHGFTFKRIPKILFYYRTKKESMFTEAYKKDAYLKAKLAVNNPELYPISYVKDAIRTIKEYEGLADYYFYYEKKVPDNEHNILKAVSLWLYNNSLEEKQTITIDNQKIALCSLELFEGEKSIQYLYQDQHVDLLLFYAPLRYTVTSLQNSVFAWDRRKGIISAKGNVFPFIPKSVRENTETQLIAYQRLLQYQTKRDQRILDDKIKVLTKEKKLVADTTRLLQKKDEEISQINNRLKTLLGSIQKITEFSITRNPIQKYKAYKAMLNIYYKIKRSENGDK